MRSTNASLSSRVMTAGKCSMTTGSAFIAANGARSSSRHGRISSRAVRISSATPHPLRPTDRALQRSVSRTLARCLGVGGRGVGGVAGAADALVAEGEAAGAVLAAPVAVALVGVVAPGPQLLLAAVGAVHRRRPLVAHPYALGLIMTAVPSLGSTWSDG